jgi:hypothetical protein
MRQRRAWLVGSIVALGFAAMAATAGAQNFAGGVRRPVHILVSDEVPVAAAQQPFVAGGVTAEQSRGILTATPERAAWRAYLAAQRQLQIQRLHEYAERGAFPANRVRPGALNVILDDERRLCAVASLMALSGQSELVEQTARDSNFIRLGTVTEGPLLEWILASGLTQEEVALIQEPYMFEPPTASRQQIDAEQARLRAHFRRVEARLQQSNAASVRLALTRLGSRLDGPPPRS